MGKQRRDRLGACPTTVTLDVNGRAAPTLQRESAERMDTLLNGIGDIGGHAGGATGLEPLYYLVGP